MNSVRRAALQALLDKELTVLDGLLADVRSRVEGIQSELESLRDEEQEAYDNLPDAIRDGDKGDAIQQAVEHLDTAYQACDDIESACDDAEGAMEAIVDVIQQAIG